MPLDSSKDIWSVYLFKGSLPFSLLPVCPSWSPSVLFLHAGIEISLSARYTIPANLQHLPLLQQGGDPAPNLRAAGEIQCLFYSPSLPLLFLINLSPCLIHIYITIASWDFILKVWGQLSIFLFNSTAQNGKVSVRALTSLVEISFGL